MVKYLLRCSLITLVLSGAWFAISSTNTPVYAASDTCYWTGAASDVWSNGANWAGCINNTQPGVPENGDNLVFPANAVGIRSTRNNIVGLTIGKITISGTGYDLYGQSLNLSYTGALTVYEDATITLNINYLANGVDIIVADTKTLLLDGANDFNNLAGTVTVNTDGTVTTGGKVSFRGAVTGSKTGFYAHFGATISMEGAPNNYTATNVGAKLGGIFNCNTPTCFGDSTNTIYVHEGTININTPGTYPNPINTSNPTIKDSAIWAYADVELTGTITTKDQIIIGQGDDEKTLTIQGGISMGTEGVLFQGIGRARNRIQAKGVISGTSNVTVDNATLFLSKDNTFTGNLSATTNSTIITTKQNGLGAGAGSVTISNGSDIRFDFAAQYTITKNITLSGSGVLGAGVLIIKGVSTTFSGDVTINNGATIAIDTYWPNSGLIFSGAISGTGDVTLLAKSDFEDNPGIQFTGATSNTYTGKTIVQGATLQLSKSDGVAVPGDLDVTATSTSPAYVYAGNNGGNQIADSSVVTLTNSGSNLATLESSLDTEVIGMLTGNGHLSSDGNDYGLTLGNGNLSGAFSGSFDNEEGIIRKIGTGTWNLTGATFPGGPTNPFEIQINEGSVIWGSDLTGMPITLASGTTLKGTGTAGNVTALGGSTINVGNSPGCLSTGILTLNSGSNFIVEITGATPCTQYDKVTSSGAVNLGNATLTLVPSVSLPVGTVLTIIQGTSISDIFNGLSEGATITSGGNTYKISYLNNAVTLTSITQQLASTGSNTQDYLVIAYSIVFVIAGIGIFRYIRRV